MPWFGLRVQCAVATSLEAQMKKIRGFQFAALPALATAISLLGSTDRLLAQDAAPTAVTLNNRTGDIPYSDQLGSNFEHIDLATGNLVVTVPIVNVPGRGMSFNYSLRYDAAFWTTYLNSTQYYWGVEVRNWLVSAGLGWTSNQPYLTSHTGQMSCYTGNMGSPGPTAQGSRLDSVIFTDSNGSKHTLLVNSQSNGECTAGSYNFNNASGPSTGQDGYFGSANSVTDPNGIVYAVGGTSGGGGRTVNDNFLNMAKMTDIHGNTQTVTPGGTDTVGRVPLTQQVSSNQIVYTVRDSNGNSQNYTVNLTNISLNTAFHATKFGNSVREASGTRSVIASIILPNGQSYGFAYDSYGDITQMSLPTGGTVSYGWSNMTLPDGSVIRHVTSRTVNDGQTSATWNIGYLYANSSNAYGDWSDTVTVTTPQDPQGVSHQSVYTYDLSFASSPVLVDIQYDPSGNTMLRHFQMTYTTPDQYFNQGNTSSVSTQPLLQSITTTLNPGTGAAVTSKREFDYDIFGFQRYDVDCTDGAAENDCELQASSGDFPTASVRTMSRGNVTSIREYADGAGTPGALIRQTIRTYLQDANPSYGMTLGTSYLKKIIYRGPNIVDRPNNEVIYDASPVCTGTGTVDDSGNFVAPPACGATKLAEKKAQYDNQNPSSYGYLGDETAIQTWMNVPTSSYLTTSYAYDSHGNLTNITDPKSHSTGIGYADNFASGVSACSITAGSSAYPTSVTDALGHVRKLTYYGCTGKVAADKDPNDIATSRAGNTWTYDSMGRTLVNALRDSGQISNSYTDTYPATKTTSVLISSGLNKTSIVNYDGLGREIKSTLSSDPQGAVMVDTSYDRLGRKYTVSNPYRNTSEATYGITSTFYDGIDRPLTVNEPDGGQQSWQYSGHSVTFTDEAGNQWSRTSDALGRLVRVLEPNGSSAAPSMQTDYTYDKINNLTQVTQWGGASGSANARVRTFAYDSLSRLLAVNNPENRNQSGNAALTCSGATGNWTGCFSYDAAGNLQTHTDDRGMITTYSVDNINRVYQKAYSNGDQSIGYTYDAAGVNGIGRRTGMTDPSGTTSWSFDAMGRPTSVAKTIAGVAKSFSAQYYLDGSPWKITYPSGAVLDYAVNQAGREVSVTDDTNGIAYAKSATYAPHGELTGLILAQTGGYTGITLNNSYNDRLQPLLLSASTSAGTLMSLQYDFHLAAGDTGSVYGVANNKDSSRSATYTYDTLKRLTSARTPSDWGVAFTYDPFGNLYQTGSVSGTQTLAMSVNQQIDPKTNRFMMLGYSYDNAGNVLTDGLTTGCGSYGYTWNAEGQQTCAAGTTYSYDGDGERVKKTGGNATATIYWRLLPGEVMAESDTSGNLKSEYIFFSGARIARRDLPSTAHYYLSDNLGSSSVVVSSQGVIENESDYYPYGGERAVTQNLPNQHYKFTGKERDTESGNDYFGARYYSSITGRWMSPDWSAKAEPVPYAKMDDPQTLNLYSYVRSCPVCGADTDGHVGPVKPGLDELGSMLDGQTGGNDDPLMLTAAGQAERASERGADPHLSAQQTKTDNLSNVVENETSSLKPDPNAKPGQPGSVENLAAGQLAIAEIANRVIDAGHPDRVASSTLYDSEAAGLKRGDPSAVDAHNRSRTAAEAAINGSNTTNGATQYRTRVGSNVTTPLGKSKTNPGTPVSMSFGPFIEGKHTVVIVVAP